MHVRSSIPALLMMVIGVGGSGTAALAADRLVGVGQPFATIADAVTAAGPGDVIRIMDPVHTESNVVINKQLIIRGPQVGAGPGVTTVQAAATRGTASAPVFTVVTTNVQFFDLTIRHGGGPFGGGIQVSGSGAATVTNCRIVQNDVTVIGGGIYSDGPLTLTDVRIVENTSGGDGGGLATTRNLTANRAEISGNTAAGSGGGLFLDSTAAGVTFALANTTISGNRADADGGGVVADTTGLTASATTTLTNVTIANNRADNNNDTVGGGGGVVQTDNNAVTLTNSLIANNFRGSTSTTADDLSGTFNSGDFNLIRSTTGASFTGTTTNNIIGQDPLIGALSNPDNAALSATHRPLAGSPARNHIPSGTNGMGSGTLARDQRIVIRVQGSAGDIGAHEVVELAVASITRVTSSPTNASSVAFLVSFNESVTGVDAGDFAVVSSGVNGASIAGVSGSGASYTVTVNTGAGSGTLRIDLVDDDSIRNASNAPLGDFGAGNGDFSGGQTYVIDRVAPSVALASSAPNVTNASITVNATVSEPAVGFTASDVTASNATVSTFSGAGTAFSFTLTPNGQGAFSARINAGAFTDAAGNSNTASNSIGSTFDSVAPSVTEITPLTRPAGATQQAFRVRWSEAVSQFDSAGDVAVQHNGTSSSSVQISATSATEYTVTVGGLAGSGSFTLRVNGGAAVDAAGNPNAQSAPSAAVLFSSSSGGNGDPNDDDPNDGDPNSGDPNDGDPNDGDPNNGDPNDGDPNNGDPNDSGDDLDPVLDAACGNCGAMGMMPMVMLLTLAEWKRRRIVRRARSA